MKLIYTNRPGRAMAAFLVIFLTCLGLYLYFPFPSGSTVRFVSQTDQSFLVKTSDLEIHFSPEVIQLDQHWQLHLQGANPEAALQWLSPAGQSAEQESKYLDIYPGSDLRIYDKGNGRVAYDLVLEPQADVQQISLRLEGSGKAYINGQGELVLPTPDGEIHQTRPYAYQELANGVQTEVESRFRLVDNEVSFALGDYDPELPLVIDPEIYFVATSTAMMFVGPGDAGCVNANEIGGVVYHDLNQSGTQDNAEKRVSGVTVTLFDGGGQVGVPQVTNANGEFLFTGLTIGNYRVEFSDLPNAYQPSFAGTGSGTTVQFGSTGSCDFNLGILLPDEYVEDNPKVVTSCYIDGDQNSSGSVLIGFDYNIAAQANEANDVNNVGTEGIASEVGTTFGLAYSRRSGNLFAAAYMKRFSGFAIGGSPGSIFMVGNPEDGNVGQASEFLDLEDYFGAGVAGVDNHDFTLVDVNPNPSVTQNEIVDGAVFDRVGKTSFGDMDINTTEDSLFVVNMENRSLYIIPLGDPYNPTPPASAGDIQVVDLVAPVSGLGGTVANAEIRPFALKYRNGYVYIGYVANGQAGGDLLAFVYSYNPGSGAFSKVLEFTLNYNRGCGFGNNVICAGPAKWNPWVSVWPIPAAVPIVNVNATTILGLEEGHPQPMFTDIEFDANGNMIIGMRDRVGDQMGSDAPYPDQHQVRNAASELIFVRIRNSDNAFLGYFSTTTPNPTAPAGSTYYPLLTSNQDAFGDILRATPNGASWTIDIVNDFTDNTLSLGTNLAGINNCVNGEVVFLSDCYNADGYLHEETSMGGLGIHQGFNSVVAPAMDPRRNAFSNGIDWFDANTSDYNRFKSITILTGGASVYGKSYGLGEIEFIRDMPRQQIGNYVWIDADLNGVQGPEELPAAGFTVKLYQQDGGGNPTLVATTTTNSDGYYYFTNNSDPDEIWETGYTEVLPNTGYYVVFCGTAYNDTDDLITFNGTDYNISTLNTGEGSNADQNDSDVSELAIPALGNFPAVSITTGVEGSSTHDFDLGLAPPITCNLNITNVQVNCSNGTDFTLDFRVEWDYVLAASEQITVTVDGVPQSPISPSAAIDGFDVTGISISGPAFGKSIAAAFSGATDCTAGAAFDLIACTPDCTAGDLGGTAWVDANNDGTQDVDELGQGNVLVSIYECDNDTPVATMWTNADGNWSVPGLSNYPYKVKYSTPLTPWLQPSFAGTDNGSDVQFADAPVCDLNYGLLDPQNYCTEDGNFAVICFTRNNDPDGESAIIFMPYNFGRAFTPASTLDDSNNWGTPAGSNAGNYPVAPFIQASNKLETGTTFGLSWDKYHKRLLTGAYMRAYSPLGTNGSANGYAEGMIYQIPVNGNAAGAPAPWLDLEDLFGDDFSGTYIADGAYPGPAVYGRTGANPNLIGYTGLGSMEISADGTELYVVNLNSREVLVIPIGADGSAPASSSDIKRFPFPEAECSGNWGDGRPYAAVLGLGVHPGTGRLYATLTCTGPTLADVTGYVYSFDPADETPSAADMTLELAIPMDIDRPATSPNSTRWWKQIDHAWETVNANAVFYLNDPTTGGSLFNPIPQEGNTQHTHPWLADIAFDQKADGTYGMIIGERNRYHDLINGSFYVTGGVLFRACQMNGSWTLENNGSCGMETSTVNWTFANANRAGSNTSAGNRYFRYVGREGSFGAGTMDVFPGKSEIIMPTMDNVFNSGTSGIAWLSTATGNRIRDNRILGDFTNAGYNATNFTKANNWAEIELMCPLPDIQLGNYVWNDLDKDGVQDACEPPVAGLTVKLFNKPAGGGDPSLLATATTDASGNYYFAGDGLDDASWETAATVVTKDSAYYIVFCGDSYESASGKISVGAASYKLTLVNVGEGAQPDLDDSDADVFTLGSLGDFPAICVTADTTDHTLDVGLKELKMSLGNFVWEDINNNSSYDPTDPDFPEAGLPNVAMSLFLDSDMNGLPDGPAIQQTTTDAGGFYIFTGLDAGKYLVGVDSANFSPGGALEIYYVSSYITEGNADLNEDQRDNGANVTYTPVIYADVLSTTIELVEDNEPDTESFFGPQGDGGATPENSNLTVDFGFFLDCDGDGVSDQLENAEPDGDRDDDGLPNECDYDPAGYIYCELSGEVVTGGTISVVSTPLGGIVEIIKDGSDGHYQFFTNGIAGVYEFTYNPPAGYTINANCASNDGGGSGSGGAFDPSPGSGDNPGGANPVVLGQGDMDGGQVELPDYGCTNNPFYFTFDLAANDPFVFNNNIPLTCPCALDITSVDVDCDNGTEFTVNVNVEWIDSDLENLSDDINVTINGQTLSATAGGSKGTLTVGPFSMSDPAYSVAVTAAFAGDPQCFDQQLIDLIACTTACTDLPSSDDAAGGTVWLDGSHDGILDGVESGQGNIKIEVYDCDNNLVCSTWTNSDGTWSCSGLTPGEEYRVEFSNPLTPWLVPSFAGTDNGTNVQFITAGDCAVDYGLFDPATACSDNPLVVVPCYDIGLAAGNTGPALVQIDHNFTGSHTALATFEQIGATWGTAYQQFSGIIFNSTFLKRNVGMAQGPGHIFMTSSGGFIGSFDLQGVNGIDLGSVNRVADVNNTLDDDYELLSGEVGVDLDAFGKIGKISFGDIDLYEEKTLFAINLNSASLIAVDVSNPAVLPTDGSAIDGALVQEFPLDLGPACDGLGRMRPWALKIYKGLGYIGAVCDASISKNRADLQAVIFTFDPADPGAGLTQVLSFALNYPREKSGFFGGLEDISANWQPWVDTWDELQKVNTGVKYVFPHHAPILVDIEFADDGGMLIGLGDRLGDQIGNLEPAPVSLSNNPPSLLCDAWSAGDILKACYLNGTFALEGSSDCTVNDTNPNTNLLSDHDGPFANGEFFYEDYFINPYDPAPSNSGHGEVNLGGLTVLAGSGEVLAPRYDPFAFFSQGLARYSTNLGASTGLYELVPPNGGSLGKANGLGDPELLCDPAPLQIGNYVWIDLDQDGIQDPCEEPLEGLMVKLYSKPSNGDDPVLLATTTTDASGNYYFAGDGLDAATWAATGETVQKGQAYFLVFCGDGYEETSGKLTVDGLPYTLTATDVVIGNQPDLHDSDAAEMTLNGTGNLPAICITADTTDHTLDLGLVPPYDFGDLPDPSYATNDASNGPKHLLSPNNEVILGSLIDDDDDGQPNTTANGDDNDGIDDEDGVTVPVMIFEGETAIFEVAVVNNKNVAAKLIGFIDWNGDGDFSDTDEMQFATVPASSGATTVTLTFNVPLDGATYANIGARFRISTDPDFIANMPSDGEAYDGEVEDYLVLVKEVDYGDLPDDYNTTQADEGPRHGVTETPLVFMGTAPDTENDGTPDPFANGDGADEDGVVLPAMFFAGEAASIEVSVTNNSGADAKLIGFIDWNHDGDFADAEEMQFLAIATGTINVTQTLTFNVPADVVTYTSLGVRFRISTDPDFIANMPSDGFAMDGEVEDYLIQVKALDYGDLPAAYANELGEDGPRHGLPEDPEVYFGAGVDPDPDGQPSATAGEDTVDGDDGDGNNDEDGLTEPSMLFQGQPASFDLAVVNNSGAVAKVIGFIDWNNDGLFNGPEEMQFTTVAANTSETVTLTFNVPLAAVAEAALGARFRISTDADFIANMPEAGFAMDGEVEDYLVTVKPLDFGDLPTPYANTYAENGPSHGLPETPEVYFGATVDPDPNGQEDPLAEGDDNDEADDDDGVLLPAMLFQGEQATFTLTAVNNSATEAKVVAWVDWNNDGLFNGPNEMVSATLAANTTDDIDLTFDVPLDAAYYTDLGVRFRISTDPDFIADMLPTGFAMDGEVEDYVVQVKPLDYGDLNDPYQTVYSDDGARHGIPQDEPLYMGADVDEEPNGQPSPTAGEDALSGDDGDMDDEDGVLEPVMIFTGGTAVFEISVTNNTEGDAKLVGYIDWNNDGQFDGPEEMQFVTVGTGTGNQTLTFTVPLDAVIYTNLGARFRLSSDPDFITNMSPNGFAMDGEVEDYYVDVKPVDYGDLPAPYPTTNADDGAKHGVAKTTLIFLGGSVDYEPDGQPDPEAGETGGGDGADENGVTEPAMIFQGEQATFTISALNITGTEAKLVGYIDWNNDGLFDGPGEMQSLAVSGVQPFLQMTFNVPLDAVAGTPLGARFRISTDEDFIANMSPTGLAMDGEVEDYLVVVKPLDFGDLDSPYNTVYEDDGPRHGVPETPVVYLGAEVDGDPDGAPSATAGEVAADGDDGDELDDEDGVEEPNMIFRGEVAAFDVAVVNNSAAAAKVVGFIDWNDDGLFDGPEEMQFTTIPANTSSTVTLSFNVPLDAAEYTDLGARFRISTDPDFITSMSPDGFVMDGEVEDYYVTVKPLDFGDLPPNYPTLYEDDAPRHGQPEEPVVYIGTAPDYEVDGQPDPAAGETGAGDAADEDGVLEPAMLFQGETADFAVTVSNGEAVDGKLVGWIDWNNDGLFDGPEEMQFATVSAGAVNAVITLTYNVPLDAAYYTDLGVRFRLSTDPEFVANMSPTGFVMDGEVEDYLVQVKPLDFGDLDAPYNTTYEEDGPRHGIPQGEPLYMGTDIDEDPNGQPSVTAGEEAADGDDGDGTDDEDGVTEPAMVFQGEAAVFDVAVTNNTGGDAKLVGYIDWNNDGLFDGPEEMQFATAGAGTTTLSLTFNVPLNAVYYTDLAARFRLSSDPDFIANMSPDGFAMDGEVEDYLVQVKPLDFGDLPNDYANEYEEDGPRHGRPENPDVYLGAGVDEDPNAQPSDTAGEEALDGDDGDGNDDEDGVTAPAMLFRGEDGVFEISVTNNSEFEAKLIGFIDWNNDGNFDDADEMQFVIVDALSGTTTQTLTFNVPQDAVVYTDLGARFRVSTDGALVSDMIEDGFVMDGEVEDYLVQVKPLDFGDLPDLFIVEYEEDGPRHGLPEEALVYIGTTVDPELDGQPSPSAGAEGDGDDGTDQDDEDGVTKPEEIFRGQPATFLVDVVNNSEDQAKLVGFADWNRDGDFEDEGEMSFVYVDAGTIAQVEVLFDVPQAAEFYLPLTGVRFRITTDPAFFTEEGMSANGFVMDGEVEDCLVEVNPVEYGDLPSSYGTLLADEGASHGEVRDGNLYLGELIDQDYDGQSDPMDMALGDDNDESDDDDGIEFLTPLIPGDTAKIRVNVTVFNDVDAWLNAWMDFDGNGQMDPADALEFFAVDGSPITPTTNLAVEDGSYVLCFLVPETATFAPGGMAYSRFRLSEEGHLQPTGFTETGEVEDYKVQLAKVGNIVWRDYNYNGIQDEDEPGIETPTEVTLIYAGEDGEFFTDDDFESRDTTDENGLYYFCGLIEHPQSMYKLIFTSDFFPTLLNVETEGDDKDSDGEITSDTTVAVMFLLDDIGAQPLGEAGINDDPNDQGNFPDAVTDQTFDQGYAGFDYGDLPDEYLTSDDSYNDEGTRHIYFPGKHLGSCIDLDLDGQPSEYGDGDDANEGVFVEGECEEVGDDEDGITFLTPLIPGYTAKVSVTYTNTAGAEPEAAILNGWIDWNGDGVLDGSDKLTFTLVDGNAVNSENLPLEPGTDVTLIACFDVPATAVFRSGNAYARFRMGCEEDMPSFGTILGGEVEDYVLPLAKIGNLAWYDQDLDGTQDGEAGLPQESGVAGVEFILTYAGYDDTEFGNGNDFEYTTTTNGDGLYNFCGLIEGKYMLEVQKYDDDENDPDHETPEHYILTVPNLGDDVLDSDFTPALMVMIPDLLENDLVTGEDGYLDAPGEEGFPDEQDDLTFDAGWIPEPNVETLLNIAGVDFGPDETNCDEFNIIVDICIKNTGYVDEDGILVGAPLAEVSALLDLAAEMGDMFVALDGAPELLSELGYDNTTLMTMPAEERLPEINEAYDGSADTELLDGTGILYPGENICIRLNITVDPTKVSMEEAMAVDLQAKVSGLAVNYQGVPIPDYFNGGAQFMAMDMSDDDWNFTGGYHDPDDAEAFGNCFKTVDPLVVHEQVNISANANCGVCIDPSEVVLGYQEACGEDNYPLGGFYRISVPGVAEDALEVCVDGTDIVDGKFTYSIRTVTQRCYPTWGYVLLEDKTLPTLVCPDELWAVNDEPLVCADVETLLIEGIQSYEVDKDGQVINISEELQAILDLTGYAVAHDNCAGLTIHVADELLPSASCEDQIIKRTFWVEAEVQGVVERELCMQLLHFTKPTLENVTAPEAVERSCTDEVALDANGNPHPDETGYPQVHTGMGTYDLAPEFCNLAAGYTDGARIEVCHGTYKVVRHWQVIDWCGEDGVKLMEFEQIIKVVDDRGPVVVCEEVDYDHDGEADLRTFSTGPYDCTAAFEVPLPQVTDACSSWEVYTEIVSADQEGVVLAALSHYVPRYVAGIPVGCYFFRYTATDGCGNKTVEYCPFQVLDQIAPIAVCDDDLNISLGGQSFARITADDVNEGSSDNCGPVRVEIRRRILDIDAYGCLDAFDYDGDGEVIGDEIRLSTEFGDPDGDGAGDQFYYTPWEYFADFNCCDMGDLVRIELRVWDDANGSGTFGDAVELPQCFDYATQTVKDNYNVCWLDVLIEDKVPPVCTPPAAVKVDCDELPYNFDPQDEVLMTQLFGAAEGFDNCINYTVEELEADTTGLNDCGSGYFIRRFRVTDGKGIASAVCQQTVTVEQVHNYWIRFPQDAQANCGVPMVDTIQTSEGACDLLAINVKEEFFSASGDECYKIFRTYSVINWCEYDGQSDPVVVSREEDCDGEPGDEAVYVIVQTKKLADPCYDYYGGQPADHYQHVWYDRDSDPFNLLPKAGTKGQSCEYETNPTGFWKEVAPLTENEKPDKDGYPANGKKHCEIASTGYWQYTQVIKVYDNVKPEILFTAPEPFCSYSSDAANGCPAEASISFQVNENCTPEDVTVSAQLDLYGDGVIDRDVNELLSSNYPDYQLSGSFPLGSHQLILTISDGCGNTSQAIIPFVIADCKAPTPVCINGLAIELMPVIPAADADGDGDLDNGAMAIWASDFIASPVYDCSGDVSYSINRVGEEHNSDQTSLVLTCEDDPSTLIEIWAYDEAGNADFCQTYVLVQDNMVQCQGSGGDGAIAGVITTEDAETVEAVTVELSGGKFQAMDTAADGFYSFEGLETGFDYTVTPHLDAFPLNGVSTFDLVLMSKHILGLQVLDSPYKLIAADVNNDRRITAMDAIQLRRLILNIDLSFANNTSWRFIPAAYVFPDPADPWSEVFPEVINLNNLQEVLDEEDFIAAKIGDIDGSAKPNLLVAEERDVKGLFLLNVQDQELKAGNTYRVDFRAGQLPDIQGYQLTLSLDLAGVALEELHYGLAQAENFGLRQLEDGLIAVSWNKSGLATTQYSAEDILFSLELRAITDGQLSDILGISNRITRAEAYDQHDDLLDLGLDFHTGVITRVPFELYQNVPNPFREETVIGFYLPEAGSASLRIHDASGRVIRLIRGEFAQGHNQLALKRTELAETGILYYTLTSGSHTATRKMILVE